MPSFFRCLQLQLVFLLQQGRGWITAVGDPAQRIMSFSHAVPAIFEAVRRRYGPALQETQLSLNYRCSWWQRVPCLRRCCPAYPYLNAHAKCQGTGALAAAAVPLQVHAGHLRSGQCSAVWPAEQ